MKTDKEKTKAKATKKKATSDRQKKATNAISAKRLDEVYQLLLDGYNRAEILQYCAENYKIKDRQADIYIQKANEKILNLYSDDDKKTMLNKHIAMKYAIYQKLMDDCDYKEANKILESIERMINIGSAEVKVNIDNSLNKTVVVETRKRDSPFVIPGFRIQE